ncbi:MAG: IclR family transcriptional regulator C-terminal domain-containing protein [Gammaproteobacteria bacterium]
MEALVERTREAVQLSVLDGDEVVHVHKLDSPEPVLGSLAGRLRRHSSKTIDDPRAFLREMERVRTPGFAVNRGEWRESVCGVARDCRRPVRQGAGNPAADSPGRGRPWPRSLLNGACKHGLEHP